MTRLLYEAGFEPLHVAVQNHGLQLENLFAFECTLVTGAVLGVRYGLITSTVRFFYIPLVLSIWRIRCKRNPFLRDRALMKLHFASHDWRRLGMGRFQAYLAKYMGTYTLLMVASYLLWRLSGAVAASSGFFLLCTSAEVASGLYVISSFLVDFAVFAYPLYVAIKHLYKRAAKRIGAKLAKDSDCASGKSAAASSVL